MQSLTAYITEAKSEFVYLKDGQIKDPKGGSYWVNKIEDLGNGNAIVHVTGGKMYNLKKIIDKGWTIPTKPARKTRLDKGRKIKSVKKSEYVRSIKGAMKDAAGDGNEEHTADLAQNMIYDPVISAYLEETYPNKRQRDLI